MIYNLFPREKVIIGEWLDIQLSFIDYPSSQYTLSYIFVGDTSQHEIVCTQNADNTFQLESEVVGDPGEYKFQAVATDSLSHKFYVDSGSVTYEINYATLTTGQDNRSHVKKVLDALEAMIEGKATSDQIYYMIEGRALSRIPPDQLMMWYEKYKHMYEQELKLERRKRGKSTGKIYVEFR